MRLRSSLVVLPVLVLLAGCAPTPAPSPSPTETTVSPSPTPSSTPTVAPTPSPTAEKEFTGAALVQLCTEKTRVLAPDATYEPEQATTEWLAEVSLWFVVIPKSLDGQESVAVCGIGGTPDAPDVVLHGETLRGSEGEIRADLLSGDDDAVD